MIELTSLAESISCISRPKSSFTARKINKSQLTDADFLFVLNYKKSQNTSQTSSSRYNTLRKSNNWEFMMRRIIPQFNNYPTQTTTKQKQIAYIN